MGGGDQSISRARARKPSPRYTRRRSDADDMNLVTLELNGLAEPRLAVDALLPKERLVTPFTPPLRAFALAATLGAAAAL